jgi:hypothetical protein
MTTTLLVPVLVLLLAAGLVYPAVWSRRPDRRAAARDVLALLLPPRGAGHRDTRPDLDPALDLDPRL